MDETAVQYKLIELHQKKQIDEIRRNYGHMLASHAFSSLYLWQNKMKLTIYLTKKFFCVKCDAYGSNNYFFPCGAEEEKFRYISKLTQREDVTFQYIRDEDRLFLDKYFPGKFVYISAREDWEYIYKKEDQINLEGSDFRHLRSKIHKGEHAHNWSVIKLSKETLPFAAEVTRRWNDEVKHNGKSADISATMNAIHYFDELKLSGVLLMADQVPLAFALGTSITENTFDLHISKTLESDIDCYLKWELYKQLSDEILYINREEDLGIEGLRIHKTQMKPFRFNELWKGWIRAE